MERDWFDNGTYATTDITLQSAGLSASGCRCPWRYENGKLGFLGIYISETDEFIGQCGLLIQDLDGTDVLEVGYHLLPKHWGNGYASEASQFFKKFAFDHDLTEKLYSMIHVDNIASQKVALRNGMTNEAATIVWNLPVYLYTINKSTYDSTL